MPESDELTITRITLRDVRGIEFIEISPGKVTQIEGRTGAGKTSFREGVRAAFSTKTDRPALVREGAEEASTIIELSDGTEVERTYKPGGKAPAAHVERDGMRAQKAQAFLDDLVNPTAFNPVSFLGLPPKAQTEELLRLVPIELDLELLKMGEFADVPSLLPGVDYDQHALLVIAEVEAAMVVQRRDIGREKALCQATGAKISAEIPSTFDAEATRATSLRESYDKLQAAQGLNDERNRYETTMAGRTEEIERLKTGIRSLEEDNTIDEAWLDAHPAVDTAPLEQAVASHEEQQQVLTRHDEMTSAANRGAELQQEYDRWSTEIERIRTLPADLLAEAELPVEGMGVNEDGAITIHGRPLAALSTGEQIGIALDVARATAGRLRVLFVDNIEALDAALQRQLIEQAREDPDFQYFVSRIGEGELEVTDISAEGQGQ